jgi:hypothetical protein
MTVLERFDVDRVTAEARDVEFGRAILTAIAAVLFAVGWLAAKVVGLLALAFGAVWLAAAWSATAVRLGWTEARGQMPARAE